MSSATPEHEDVAEVRKLLYRRFKVQITGGRVLMGDFQCLDKQGNLILGNAHETVTTATGASENKHMGMVLIPKEQQVKVEVQATLEEQVTLQARIGGDSQ